MRTSEQNSVVSVSTRAEASRPVRINYLGQMNQIQVCAPTVTVDMSGADQKHNFRMRTLNLEARRWKYFDVGLL